jgi:hypothetical protein
MSNARQTEFFGPDLGRGPFSSNQIETAIVQIATALAQLRAPLSRSDDDLKAHADFIRILADRLAPDYASQVVLSVGALAAMAINTTIRTALSTVSLLRCWLTDAGATGETATTPDNVTWNSGVILQTVTAKKHYWVLTTTTGAIDVSVQYGSVHTWRWAVARQGRVYFSSNLIFV